MNSPDGPTVCREERTAKIVVLHGQEHMLAQFTQRRGIPKNAKVSIVRGDDRDRYTFTWVEVREARANFESVCDNCGLRVFTNDRGTWVHEGFYKPCSADPLSFKEAEPKKENCPDEDQQRDRPVEPTRDDLNTLIAELHREATGLALARDSVDPPSAREKELDARAERLVRLRDSLAEG